MANNDIGVIPPNDNGVIPPGDNPTGGASPTGDDINPVMLVAPLRLPPFWKVNPTVWFIRIEAAFNNHRIRADSSKFDYVVAALDDATVQEIADVLMAPPAEGKYDFLKAEILKRMTDTADQRLRKLLTQLKLGDQKPSQPLRRMKALAGTAVADDAIRVRWFDLLPPSVARSLRVVKSTPLDELASLADELIQDYPHVAAVHPQATKPQTAGQSSAPTVESLAKEMASLLARRPPKQVKHAKPRPQRPVVLVPSHPGEQRSQLQATLQLHPVEPGKRVVLPSYQVAEVGATTPAENRLHVSDKTSTIRFLVDSGSVVSLLPASLFKKPPARASLTLTAANASAISTYGTHRAEVNLGLRRAFVWSFIVADVQTAILGADFLTHFSLLIDLKGKQLPRKRPYDRAFHQGFCGPYNRPQRLGRPAADLPNLPVLHRIHTNGPPVFERPRRLIGPRLDAAKDEFSRLMAQGIIWPSSSQWASPIHLVPKPDGSWRVSGDYRRLNSCTTPDHYSLPIVEDLLQELQGSVFSVIDLKKAFYQIPIAKEDIPKTSLQRTMDHLLRDLPFARAYLDDIIVTSEDNESHLVHLRRLFESLRSAGLRINPAKAANILAPLNDLLQGLPPRKKKVELTWTLDAEAALARSKQAIADATTTTFQRPDTPKLDNTEKRYSTYDQELLAIYAALKNLQRILEGRSFTIFTDHKPLVFAAAQRSDKASPRQARQLDFILQFNTSLVHVKGDDNVVADALSRVATISMPAQLSAKIIAKAQAEDHEAEHVSTSSSLNLQTLSIDDCSVLCDTSTGVVRPYLPRALRRTAFEFLHGLAHPSVRATTCLVASKYVWSGMRKEVSHWARTCEPCQRSKIHRHNRSALGSFEVPEERFQHLHINIIKLPPCQGYNYCLTIIDRFTRWPEAIPLPDQQASTIAKALVDRWVSLYGTPLTITTDQGAHFESALFSELTKLLGAKRVYTTPYHPQSNIMVKRTHRTIKAALMCDPGTPWPDRLSLVLLGLRTAYKEDLQASPAEMLYGTTLRVPGDFFATESQPVANPATFVEGLRRLAQSIKAAPASRHAAENAPFFFKDLRTCSHVFKRVDAIRKPLQPPYTGPHRVIRRVDDKTYVINVNGSHRTVFTDALKPAYVEATDSSPLGDQPTNPPNAPPADSSPAPKPPAATPETAPKDAPPKKREAYCVIKKFKSENYVKELQGFSNNLYEYAMRVFEYMYLTKDLNLMYKKNKNVIALDSFVNLDSAGQNRKRKSTSGYIVKLFETFCSKLEKRIEMNKDSSGAVRIAKFENKDKIKNLGSLKNNENTEGIIDFKKISDDDSLDENKNGQVTPKPFFMTTFKNGRKKNTA
ncbi:uncharacterized protein K02A2.6-like [Copidosoma floridanum]|uniref:uncharacterized protein K02A2.6-like n=1 Tax=Copidosoma floridanum TaxID=29053 RepID=UPI000C6F45CC|nr:uncharacterized protein K02A2.6-like [Copidosoma floridanum]